MPLDAGDSLARAVIQDWEREDGERGTFKIHWQQCANYMQTERNDYIVERTPGMKRMQYIFDSTPVWCLNTSAAAFHGLMCSPTLRWFDLGLENERLDSIGEVRVWFEQATDDLYTVFSSPRFNFASQAFQVFLDELNIGTAFMMPLEGKEGDPYFLTKHMKECCIMENDQERVDGFVRRWKWTAQQAFQWWGEKAGAAVLRSLENDKRQKQFVFYHRVIPRLKRDPGRADRMNKPFESVYVSELDGTISVGGFDEFPALVPRFSKVTGEKYGRGPGMTALPDVKMLNELMKLIVKSAQKVIDPPLQAPDQSFIAPIRTVPGSINWYRSGTPQMERIAPIVTGANLEVGDQLLESLRQSIGRIFFTDLARAPEQMTDPEGAGKDITATYTLRQRDQEMVVLSPYLARHNEEFSDPLISRVFAMRWRKSARLRWNINGGSPFPPPPPQISGQKFKVRYISPIALAQRASQLTGINQLVQQAQILAQIDPRVGRILDTEFILRTTGRDLNTPFLVLKTPQAVQQQDQQDQAAAQQQQEAAYAANMGKAASHGSNAIRNLAMAGQTMQGGAPGGGAQAGPGGPP
jgi:hypothetical protein